MATKSFTLNLTIDNTKNKVVFAESDKDFVDVLLSFLTIPLGTLINVCNKNSSIICLDNLYKSVEGLSDKHFKTTPCREMLLTPNYEAELKCLDLPLNVEGNTDRALVYYTCLAYSCHELLSWYKNAQCACGSKMVHKVKVIRGREKEIHVGVFLKSETQFMITDNFTVMPASTQAMFNLLDCAGTSISNVVQKQVKVGLPEIIAMLHKSLISEDTFTKVFLAKEDDSSLEKKIGALAFIPGPNKGSACSENTVGIKLIVDKHDNKVLYAECKQDFIDILFGFLTYPSGFVIKRLNGKSHLACLDNLFASALSTPISGFFKTDEMKDYVVNPKLPSHFRSTESLIKSDEVVPMRYMCWNRGCLSTDVSLVPNMNCCRYSPSGSSKTMKITDPRNSSVHGLLNHGFVSDATYIVTDDLVVTPFCSILTFSHKIANAMEGVIEIPVNIGENEVLALMEATLVSKAVFTDVFLVKEGTTTEIITGSDDSDCVVV